jgi:hypothetical protein
LAADTDHFPAGIGQAAISFIGAGMNYRETGSFSGGTAPQNICAAR